MWEEEIKKRPFKLPIERVYLHVCLQNNIDKRQIKNKIKENTIYALEKIIYR